MNNKATNKTNKFHWWPIIKLALTVFVILAIIDPSLFFDMTPTPEPKVKLNTYWIKNEQGENETLIGNFGEFKLKVVRDNDAGAGVERTKYDYVRVRRYWPSLPVSRDEIWRFGKELKYQDFLSDDIKGQYSSPRFVELLITYIPSKYKGTKQQHNIKFSSKSPPSALIQRLIPREGFNFFYNGKKESVSCAFMETMFTDKPKSCSIIVILNDDLYIYIDVPGMFLRDWGAFSADLYKFIDTIFIEPDELDY